MAFTVQPGMQYLFGDLAHISDHEESIEQTTEPMTAPPPVVTAAPIAIPVPAPTTMTTTDQSTIHHPPVLFLFFSFLSCQGFHPHLGLSCPFCLGVLSSY